MQFGDIICVELIHITFLNDIWEACQHLGWLVSLLHYHVMFMNYFSVVDESGASIYSVSDQAVKELPTLDPSLRGAGMYSQY